MENGYDPLDPDDPPPDAGIIPGYDLYLVITMAGLSLAILIYLRMKKSVKRE